MPYDDVTNTNIHLQAFRESKPVIRTDIHYFDSNIPILKNLIFKKGDSESLLKLIQNIPSPSDLEYRQMVHEINSFWDSVSDDKDECLQEIINLIPKDS